MVLAQDQAQRSESERIIEYRKAKAQYELDLAQYEEEKKLYEQQQAELEKAKADEQARLKAEADAKAKAEAEAKAKAEALAKEKEALRIQYEQTLASNPYPSTIQKYTSFGRGGTQRGFIPIPNPEYTSYVTKAEQTYKSGLAAIDIRESGIKLTQVTVKRTASKILSGKIPYGGSRFTQYEVDIATANREVTSGLISPQVYLTKVSTAQAKLDAANQAFTMREAAKAATSLRSLTIQQDTARAVAASQGIAIGTIQSNDTGIAVVGGASTTVSNISSLTPQGASTLAKLSTVGYNEPISSGTLNQLSDTAVKNITTLKGIGVTIDPKILDQAGVMEAYNKIELKVPEQPTKPSDKINVNVVPSSRVTSTDTTTNLQNLRQSQYTQELRAGNVGLATALLQPQTTQTYFVSGLGQVPKSKTSINIERFLTERGYDISRPDLIPDSVFKPVKYTEARAAARDFSKPMGDLTRFVPSFPQATASVIEQRTEARARVDAIAPRIPQVVQSKEGYFYPPKPVFTVTTSDGTIKEFKTYAEAQKYAEQNQEPIQTVAGSLSYIFRPEPKTTPTQEFQIGVSKFLDEAAKFKTGNVVLDQIIDPLKFPIGVTRSVVEGLSTLDNLGKQTVAPFVDQALGRKPTQYTVTPVRQTGDAIIFPYSFEDNRFKSWGEVSAQSQQYIREYGGGTFAGEVVSLVVPTGKSIYDVGRRIGTGIAPKLIPKITPTLAAAAISEARITPKVAVAVKTEVAAQPQGLIRYSRANEIDLPKGFEPAAVSVTPKPSDYGTLGQNFFKAPITDTVIAPNYGVVSKATVTAINESQKSPVFYRLLKLTSESKAPERPNLNILQELKAAQKLQRDTDIANQIKIANQKPQPQPKNISRANEIYAELDRDVINTVGLKSQEIPDAARGVSRGGLDLKKISQEILDEMRYKKFKIEQPIVTDVQPTGNFPLRDFVPRTPIPFRDTNVVRETVGRLGITKSKAPITKTRYIVDTAPQIPKTGVAPQIKGIPVKEVGKAPFDPLFVKFKGRVEPIPEGVSIGKPVKDFPPPPPTLDVLTSSGTPVGYGFKGVTRYDKGITSFAQFQKALEPKTISSATTPKSPRVDPTYGKIMTGGQAPRYSPMSFTRTPVNVKSPIVNPTYERLTASSGQPYTASAFRTAEKSTSISLGRGLGEIVSKDDPRFIDKGLKAFKDFQSLIRQPPDFVPSAPRKGVFRPDTTIKLGRGLGEIVSKDHPRFIDKGLKGFKEFQERIENPKFNLPTSSKSPLSFTRPTSAPKPRDFNKPRDFKKPRDFTKSDEGGLKEGEGKGGTLLQVVKEESPLKSTQISLGKGKDEVIIKKKSALSDPEPSKDPLISTGGLSGTSQPTAAETVSSTTIIPTFPKRETVKPRQITLQQPQTKVEVKVENILQTKSEIISKTQTIVSPKLTTIVSPKLTTKISPKLTTKISPKLVTEVTPKLGTKQTPKLGTRQQLKTPTPQRPKLRSRPMFKFQAKAQTKLDNPPIVPTRRRVVGGLPSPDKGKKKKGKKKSDTGIEFLGSSKLDSIVGLFRREAVIFGDKQVSKQVKRDTKVKVKI